MEQLMEDIIKTREGQRFFDFLDVNWNAMIQLSYLSTIHYSINKMIELQEESFNFEAMEEHEYDSIIQYFFNVGSSY